MIKDCNKSIFIGNPVYKSLKLIKLNEMQEKV